MIRWVAIGILVLLALSLSITSRPFRVFMSWVGGVVMMLVLVIAVLALGSNGQVAKIWQRLQSRDTWTALIPKSPSMQEIADETSEQVLAKIGQTDVADSIDDLVAEADRPQSPGDANEPNPEADLASAAKAGRSREPVQVRHFEVQPTGASPDEDRLTVQTKMSAVIEKYLEIYRQHNRYPGVATLKPEHLNWNMLKYRVQAARIPGMPGMKYNITLVFDDQFHQHVRQRARQLLTIDRVKTTFYASLWTLAVVAVLFGVLKLKQVRRKEFSARDHLLSSGVEMV